MATVLKFQPPVSETAPITLRFDRIYGKVLCYPANDRAELAAQLVGKKTFSPSDVNLLAQLGFEVKVNGIGENTMLIEFMKGGA